MTGMGVGILGAGMMSERMATTMARMENVRLRAVAVRDLWRAQAFAERHGIEKAYGSYEELMEDALVQLVYIATPNAFHFKHAMLCLNHDKHVLCEKPFTVAVAEAKEIFDTAKGRGILATEAIWTRYLPFIATIRRILKEETLGELVCLSANIGNDVSHMERLHKPSLGGGAFLDLGVYALHFADLLFEEYPKKVDAICISHPSGVDAQNTITLSYSSGKMASLFTSMMVATNKRGVVYGKKGYLEIESINNPTCARLYSPQRELQEEFHRPEQISGLEYEVEASINAIRCGLVECPEVPHAATLAVLRQMEKVRMDWGVLGRQTIHR